MISPERLRFYPFFRGLTNAQLQALAHLAHEKAYETSATLFEMGQPAPLLYMLVEGCIDLYFSAEEFVSADFPLGVPVGEVCPGEVFSTCALIEPHEHSATARVAPGSRLIQIDANGLHALFEVDAQLAYTLTKQAAQTVRARLDATRVLIAAALAEQPVTT